MVIAVDKQDEPSKVLLSAFKEAKEDRKVNSHYSFKSAKEAVDFIDKMIVKKEF